MANTHQRLLDSSNNPILGCKILYVAATLFAVIFSSTFLVPLLIREGKSDLSPVSLNICRRAHDPEECLRFVSEVVFHGARDNDSKTLLKKFLLNCVRHMKNAMVVAKGLKNQINDQYEQGAVEDCIELIDLSIDRVTDSVMALASSTRRSQTNAQAWLSGVLTNIDTCFDGLNFSRRTSFGKNIEDLISRSRTSLALLAGVTAPDEEMLQPLKGKLPSWVTPRDRKLLESSAEDIEADLVVAQDGTGNYSTLAEAVAAAPNKTKTRFVIHVKNGTYEENVEVIKNKKNLMIVGDGMNSTIITGSLNVVNGSTTFRSATLAAVGDGFILQDICIRNTAGPEKHQAVALRVGADQSVINRCQIDAYQDSLYAHSQRQFYRDCNVSGTIDFIFGNAAVVFQNCKLIARKPMENQKNMVTAQGRKDPNQNTGTSIQYCHILASDELEPVKSSFPSYLGRPWKEYARVAIMQSYIGDHIDPAGWSEWDGDFALKTLYFGEYLNVGPGADTSNRVNWTGYHNITDPFEALQFTVLNLIQGDEWLDSTVVAFVEGL